METPSRVVVVGAGQAGATVAAALREEGFDGAVTLIGAEPHAPYERPPLSKAYLRGETARADARLQAADFWAARGIGLRTGVRVERVDATVCRVELADGSAVDYDRLVLATGSAARSLSVPGADLGGVLTLRTFEDADHIRTAAQEARQVLVVGGGWIGSEVTASLRQMGIPVTLAVSGDRPLHGALGDTVGGVYDGLHREHGAVVLPGTRVTALQGDGRVRGARTAAGDLIEADLVVTAVGARPRLDLARSAGVAVSDGVVVDGLLRTSDPRILAVGDVAQARYPDLGRSLRFEHWGTARSQGTHAARTILGGSAPYDELPYFFSDQYDTGMEFWGDPALPGDLVVRGDPSARSFTGFWFRSGRIHAVLNMHVHHHEHADRGGDGEHRAGGEQGGHSGDSAEHAHGHEGVAVPDGGRAGVHAGGHVDPEVVARLLRSSDPIDVRALLDPGVALEQLARDVA